MSVDVVEASRAVFGSFSGLADQQHSAASASLDTVVAEFESLFINEWLKAARGAEDVLFADNPLRSQQVETQRDWHDSQLARQLAQRGGLGLGDVLRRQLDPQSDPAPGTAGRGLADYRRVALPATVARTPLAAAAEQAVAPKRSSGARSSFDSPEAFVARVMPLARAAAESLGVPAHGVLAQAALETGWGRQVPVLEDGSSANNLFGIKAGADWQGATVERSSREYLDGRWVDRVSRFRAYPDLQSGFQDYVRFLRDDPRYAEVIDAGDDPAAFADALQRAGYATDPRYGEKIARIAAAAAQATAAHAPDALVATATTPEVGP